MDPAKIELPANPDVIEHEDGTIEYHGRVIRPVAPLELPDAEKIKPRTHIDIQCSIKADKRYRGLLASYLFERAADELPANPDYIADHADELSGALGRNISREDLSEKILRYVEEFNGSWSLDRVTDAHVRFYPPLRVLQDRIKDLVDKANRWSAERYGISGFVWRGTDEEEARLLAEGKWSVSRAGRYEYQDYRSASTNPYVAREYTKSTDSSQIRLMLDIPKDVLEANGLLVSPEYVGDASGTAVKGNEAYTEKRRADTFGLEEHFLLRNVGAGASRRE